MKPLVLPFTPRARKLRLIKQARKGKLVAPLRLLTVTPPIFYGIHQSPGDQCPWADFRPVQEYLREREAWFLCSFSWTMASPHSTGRLREDVARNQRRYPRHHFTFLTNTEAEQEWLTSAGLNAIWCNHNCFVDERIFGIIPGAEKRFDAIYNARLNRFKRLELAAEVPRLSLLTYMIPQFVDQDYAEDTLKRLAPAHRWNWDEATGYRRLDPREVNAALNACRVGLCLSEVEGAMYASMEYLLAGLPIVSTPSIGGRDVFFDDENAIIVEPTPGAVAEGVRALIARNLDPERIRARALERVWEHRHRFFRLVNQISLLAGRPRDISASWDKLFVHQLTGNNSRQDKILQKLARHEGLLKGE